MEKKRKKKKENEKITFIWKINEIISLPEFSDCSKIIRRKTSLLAIVCHDLLIITND